MSKLIGKPDWVIQPDYPALTGQDGEETIVVKVIATAGGLADQLPTYGDYFKSDDPFFQRFTRLSLTGRSVTLDNGGKTYTVVLTYAVAEGDELDGNSEAVVKMELERLTQDCDVPISQHPDYRYCWNHCLCAKEATAAVPGWHSTARTGEMSKDVAAKYRWLRPGDPVPDDWFMLRAETEGGIESYRAGVTTVQMVQRCTNKNYLNKSAEADYTIQNPPETFGRPGEWLRGGSSIRKEGRYWVLTVNFLNALRTNRKIYK